MQKTQTHAKANAKPAEQTKQRRAYSAPTLHSQRGLLQGLIQSGCTQNSCPDTVACPTAGFGDPC